MLLQVALHDRVLQRGPYASLQQTRVAMSQAVHADACDEVELDATIGQLDPRTIADATTEVAKVGIAAARDRKSLEQLLEALLMVGSWRARTSQSTLRIAEGSQQQLLGLDHARIVFEPISG